MNAKITYRLIKSLTPKEKPYEVTGADVPGTRLTESLITRQASDNRVRNGGSNLFCCTR